MIYDKDLLLHKLQRWDGFINAYSLPAWEAIPDFGLYMDQVIVLLQQYLSFIPSEGKESFVTASTINNYVRLKVMPAPVKRKYYRIHIAWVMMILTLKLSLSISDIQRLLRTDMTEAEVRLCYEDYSRHFLRIAQAFDQEVRAAQEAFADPEQSADTVVSSLIVEYALTSGFNSLLARKLINLGDSDPQAVLAAEEEAK